MSNTFDMTHLNNSHYWIQRDDEFGAIMLYTDKLGRVWGYDKFECKWVIRMRLMPNKQVNNKIMQSGLMFFNGSLDNPI